MPEVVDQTAFMLPPVIRNQQGAVRMAGFEFEYAGLTLHESAALVMQVFGGRHEVESTYVQFVRGTPYGDFSVEIDSTFLKQKQYENWLRSIGFDPAGRDTSSLENLLIGVAANVVPFEIGAPPIPITELAPLEDLRRLLCEHDAEGTRASILYSFGLHINPEAPSVDPRTAWDYLRAFLLLYPWLQERVQVDITRRVRPYVNPFPAEYARLVLDPDYRPATDRLIADYITFNPTRNRPLDLLPLLACLDADAVKRQVEDPHLVKPRPAFHYRMPNSQVDEPDWTLAREWNTWVAVERLANDPDKLARMAKDYVEADGQSLRPFVDRWPDVLQQYVDAPGA